MLLTYRRVGPGIGRVGSLFPRSLCAPPAAALGPRPERLVPISLVREGLRSLRDAFSVGNGPCAASSVAARGVARRARLVREATTPAPILGAYGRFGGGLGCIVPYGGSQPDSMLCLFIASNVNDSRLPNGCCRCFLRIKFALSPMPLLPAAGAPWPSASEIFDIRTCCLGPLPLPKLGFGFIAGIGRRVGPPANTSSGCISRLLRPCSCG